MDRTAWVRVTQCSATGTQAAVARVDPLGELVEGGQRDVVEDDLAGPEGDHLGARRGRGARLGHQHEALDDRPRLPRLDEADHVGVAHPRGGVGEARDPRPAASWLMAVKSWLLRGSRPPSRSFLAPEAPVEPALVVALGPRRRSLLGPQGLEEPASSPSEGSRCVLDPDRAVRDQPIELGAIEGTGNVLVIGHAAEPLPLVEVGRRPVEPVFELDRRLDLGRSRG